MRKTWLIALMLISALTITLTAQALLTPDDVPRMSIDELKRQMGSPKLVIIDVRTPHDWGDSGAKIKGSIREEPAETDSWMSKYPPDRTIVFYCA